MKNNNQINLPLISRGHGQVQDTYLASVVSDLGSQVVTRTN